MQILLIYYLYVAYNQLLPSTFVSINLSKTYLLSIFLWTLKINCLALLKRSLAFIITSKNTYKIHYYK